MALVHFPVMTPLFALGSVWVTQRAVKLLGPLGIQRVLTDHAAGDWGNVSSLRAKMNALALDQGYPVLSQYIKAGTQIFIFTEDDRTATWLFAAEIR